MSEDFLEDEYSTESGSDDFYIGLGLAVASSIFIGASFIIKKKGLIKLQKYGSLRAGSGGFGYLREWIWWAGLLSMGMGELANFIAYAFAPASLVTPLGALSVLVAAALASEYLNEKLNLLGKISCLLCILGSTVVVLHSPKENKVEDMNDLLEKMKAPAFLTYVFLALMCIIAIVYHYGPAYGKHNVFVYLLLCSTIGSLLVMSCKGFGLALKRTALGVNEMGNWLTWLLLFSIILSVMAQMNYLNKALDLFNIGIVTTIYYVLFTSLVIIASTILFREWEHMKIEDILGSFCGFLTVIIAIFLLHSFKDVDINYSDISHSLRPKRDTVINNSGWERESEEKYLTKDLEDGYKKMLV